MESKNTNWIWLRGLARGGVHWYDFESHFRKYFPDVKIEVLDLPGNGTRSHEKSAISISANADFVRENSKLIQQGERPFVLSISMGAMVAMDWAHRYPEELQGIVCINTSAKSGLNHFQRLRPTSYGRLIQIILKKDPVEREELILDLITQRRSGLKQIAKDFVTATNGQSTSVENSLRQILAASRFHIPKREIRRPILFLNSKRDEMVDYRCSEIAATALGGELRTHPTAGHDLPLDDGDWVSSQISDWILSLSEGKNV